MSPPLSERIRRWQRAWQEGAAEAVAALYHADGVHESAKVVLNMPELGRSALYGPSEIEAYAHRAFARAGKLKFVITGIVEDRNRSAVEYLRTTANDQHPQRVAEFMVWRGDRMAACSVYHF